MPMKSKSPTGKTEPTVIGIGASAGGLAALKTFLSYVPEDSGLTFVVVVHLSPDHESHLAELLQPQVHVPVQQVVETIPLEANHVYVIPPNANLNAIDTHLRLSKLEERRQERAPIDHFFRTLASAHDGRSIAVVLTGTGSDGTLGIKDVKARGGLVIVQDPNEAEYDGMPQSAIATGMADFILPLAEIPAAILRFDQTEPRVPEVGDGGNIPPDEHLLLKHILALLRTRTERDFSHYKPSTVLRRISRRMQLNHIEDMQAYVEVLRDRLEEARALADDLLITVTHFFRDPEVFEKLEKEVVPGFFKGKGQNDVIRVWSVGCATGEEAYSIAIILTEAAARLQSPPQIQIFASDLHSRSLTRAREGLYSGDIEADVSPERLREFFQQESGGYRIKKEIRDLIVFSPHNILSDPPFSRMDLISCRNLLIYLERDVQLGVTEILHYALNGDGVLLLGSAESVETSDLFRTIDKRLCLFAKRNGSPREPRLPVFPATGNRFSAEDKRRRNTHAEPAAVGELHQRLVEHYAPPSILVGPDNKLLHSSQHAGRYMVVPGGKPTMSALKLVREELQLDLQASLHEVREKRQAVDTKPIPVRLDGGLCTVVMHARPALEPEGEGYALIIFEERAPYQEHGISGQGDTGPLVERIKDLEAQLVSACRQTQTVVDEFDASRERMSASSEEMQSTNEELRSTMEELETSKEELQSLNEELQTVNQQNRHKVEELAQLSGDLQNLLTATDIATLFLDRHLRIMRFTPKLGDLFNVRIMDRGRPIADLTHKLGYPELASDALTVLNRLVPMEREVQDEAGTWYLARVLPYRTNEDRIDGVVITFIDIDARKKAAAVVAAAAERLTRMVNVDVVGVLIFNEDGTLIDSNETYRNMSGYSKEEISSRKLTWRTMTPPEYVEASEDQLKNLAAHGRISPYEKEYIRKDGSRSWMLFAGASLGDGTFIEYCIDVSDRKKAEEEVVAAKYYAESIIETLHEPILVLTPELIVQSANPAFYQHFEVEPATTLGRKIYDLGNRQWDIPALRILLENVLPENHIFEDFEVEHTFEEIGARTMLVNARRLDKVQLILLGIRDITDRKGVENDLRASDQNLRLANQALIRANSDLQHFSYAVSHDMQESLRMVTSYAQLLARDYAGALDADAGQFIDYALLGASRMESMLTNLRDYWFVSDQKIEQLDPVDCNLILDDALAYLEPVLKETAAVITHDPLPTIRGERYPLTLLFQNLISNGVKYRQPGTTPEIHVSVQRQDSGWMFAVTDNGIGIDPQHFETIFIPFKRLHNKGTHPGTGLGLAMCRRIVERYNGRILVDSANGYGSTFRFTVPDADGER
jgi:two-component system, chemotaxis family, CheB/CheR fusion protein